MPMRDDQRIEARLARLERLVEELHRRLPPLPETGPAATSPSSPVRSDPATPEVAPAPREGAPVGAPRWDGEFWLNRLGIALLLLGVAFLFRYSIDQGWLTPAVRVGFGVALGIALFGAGARMAGRRFATVLLGGGIATFYVTGFAAFYLYGMVGYVPAFVGMMAITLAAFGIGLRTGSPALAVLGAAGGLGTPLLLGISHGTPGGFALHTCAILAWSFALYLVRGWRSLLWVSTVGGWLLLVLYADGLSIEFRRSAVDRWILQGAVLFTWLGSGALPLARRVLRERRADREALRRDRRGSELDTLHWYLVSVLPPAMALAVMAAIWHPRPELWGAWVVAVSLSYAAVARSLRTADPLLARALLFCGALLLPAGLMAALNGEALLLALTAEALFLHLVSVRGGGAPARWTAHKLFLLVAGWTLFRILEGSDVGAARALADLAVLAAACGMSYALRSRREVVGYRLFAHLGFLAWLWWVLSPFAGGAALVTVAWGGYGVAVLLVAMRRGYPVLERTAVATLLLVVVKLFLWDLAALEPLHRVLLFLGVGGAFLFLSYSLPAGWRGKGRSGVGARIP